MSAPTISPGEAERGPQATSAVEALSGDYEFIRELGRGGMATVYLARERTSAAEVAIKIVHRGSPNDAEALVRFEREASTVARLHHPNIVEVRAVHHLGAAGVAMVMDHIPGHTLREHLRRAGPLPIEEVQRLLVDVASAMAHAHAAGVVHRDIKPENIFLDERTGRALLADFGIARSIQGDSQLTITGVSVGTPAYMSPEQVDGTRIDGRSDIYSLGVVGWEMLTGKRPWDGESLYGILWRQKHDRLPRADARRDDIPSQLLATIEQALEKEPVDRPPTAELLLEMLTGRLTIDRPATVEDTIEIEAPADDTVYFRRLPATERHDHASPSGRSWKRTAGVMISATLLLAMIAAVLFRAPRPSLRPAAPVVTERAGSVGSPAPASARTTDSTTLLATPGRGVPRGDVPPRKAGAETASSHFLATSFARFAAAFGLGGGKDSAGADSLRRILPTAPNPPADNPSRGSSGTASANLDPAHPSAIVGTWSHYSPNAALADSSALVLRADGVARSTEKRLADERSGWQMQVITYDGTWQARPSRSGGMELCLRWRMNSRAIPAPICSEVVLPSDSLALLEFGGRYWRRISAAP